MLLLLSSFIFSDDSFAVSSQADIEALNSTAYAANQSSADRQAINQLQQKLKDVIKKTPAYCVGQVARFVVLCDGSNNHITTQDHLPLLGVQFERTSKTSILSGVKVFISREKSLAAYQAVLKNEKEVLNNWSGKKEKVRGLQRAKLSHQDLELQLSRYYQLAIVAAALGDDSYLKTVFELPETEKSHEIANQFTSIDAAASYVANKLTASNIFIFPLRPATSVEVTPFGRAFQDTLKTKITNQVANTPFGFNMLSGAYYKRKDHLEVTYQLYSKEFLLQNRIRFRLIDAAVGDLRVEPVSPKFEKVFVNKMPVKTDFSSELTTDLGAVDLLFRKGESVKLYVRLSKPGYFYVVGHVAKKDAQYSYLLDIGEGSGDERFISYIAPEKTNQLVELGEFDVDAPYGVEYLQLVSSTADLRNQLPEYTWDKKLEYFVINGSEGNALSGVKKVRGLKKKRKNVQYHESQMVYTTMPK